MANEIVKFNNQFNNVALKGFTSQELNLLITIASKLKEKKGEKVIFDFFDLKKYIKLNKNETTKEFIKNVMNVNKKLLKINFIFFNQNKIIQFALFKSFVIDTDLQTLEVSVNDEFIFLLNELTSNFTRFELEEFVKFKSTYTKEFYRRMKQFRHTGVWKISIDDFNRLLGISESYKISDIDKRVFQPILNELGEKYNLKIIKKYSKKAGRGRSRVVGFEFKFSPEKREKSKLTKKDKSEKSEKKEKPEQTQEKEKTLREKIKEKIVDNNGVIENMEAFHKGIKDSPKLKDSVRKLVKKIEELKSQNVQLKAIYDIDEENFTQEIVDLANELIIDKI